MTTWRSVLDSTTVASRALVVGDPDRAEQAAANLAVDPDKEITSIGIQRMIEIALNALAGLE